MNPLVVEALGSIVRWVLAIGAGFVVEHGIWTSEDASKYVTAAAMALVALAWSIWQKYGMRLKLVTTLTMPVGSTEHEVESKVAGGLTPPVTLAKTDVPE